MGPTSLVGLGPRSHVVPNQPTQFLVHFLCSNKRSGSNTHKSADFWLLEDTIGIRILLYRYADALSISILRNQPISMVLQKGEQMVQVVFRLPVAVQVFRLFLFLLRSTCSSAGGATSGARRRLRLWGRLCMYNQSPWCSQTKVEQMMVQIVFRLYSIYLALFFAFSFFAGSAFDLLEWWCNSTSSSGAPFQQTTTGLRNRKRRRVCYRYRYSSFSFCFMFRTRFSS
jgi:hypothetical protein